MMADADAGLLVSRREAADADEAVPIFRLFSRQHRHRR